MNFTLFLDLDGVIVDFNKKLHEIGWDENQLKNNKEYYDAFWKYLIKATEKGFKFWSHMEPMPGADILWSHIKKYNPIILSSAGHVKAAHEQKRYWVHKFLGPHVQAIITDGSEEKSKYATPSSILIDDREKSLGPWRAKGGIGILYTDPQSAIKELEEIIHSLNHSDEVSQI